jgi:hypothetical protein
MRWWIKGGSKAQRRAIRLAVVDLKAALGVAGRKSWPGKLKILIDEYAFSATELEVQARAGARHGVGVGEDVG